MKKLILSLVAVSLLTTGATAASSSLASQVELTSDVLQSKTVTVEALEPAEVQEDEIELYYDHIELEAPIIDIQVEAEIETP